MAQEGPTISNVTWQQYLADLTGTESSAAVARKIAVDQSTVSRWRKGTTGGVTAERVAALARAYGRPVLEAFIAARIISAEEAGEKPAAAVSLEMYPDSELLEELQARADTRQKLVQVASADPDLSAVPGFLDWLVKALSNPPGVWGEVIERLAHRDRESHQGEAGAYGSDPPSEQAPEKTDATDVGDLQDEGGQHGQGNKPAEKTDGPGGVRGRDRPLSLDRQRARRSNAPVDGIELQAATNEPIEGVQPDRGPEVDPPAPDDDNQDPEQ